MDYGHEQTDKELKRLEQKITREYEKAYKEVKQKADDYFKQFQKADADKKKLVDAGLMSEKDYFAWRQSAMLTSKRWDDMANVLAQDLVNADKIAASMIGEHLPDVYALNANYGAYEIEDGLGINTSWTMYDHSTVENLMRKNPQIVPKPSMDIPKDMRWNRQKIHSAITQGVLQGDSIPDIAKRLRRVTDMDRTAAIRNARTYTTAAENKGRIDSYQRAKELGIDLQKEWMATPDGRTRDSHVDLDGERVEIDGTFSNGCRYPADPMGDPAEVYNCRCTLVAAVRGRQYHDDRFTRLPEGMTYEDWKAHKLNGDVSDNKPKYSSNGITEPQRPRKFNYSSDEEYQKARDDYKIARQEYDKKMNDVVKNALSIERFSSKDDIIEWSKRAGIEIDSSALDVIDARAFNESSIVLDEMFKRFPEVKNFSFITPDGKSYTSTFRIGLTNDGLLSANGGFNFNKSYFSSYEEGLRQALEQQTDGSLVRGDGTFGSLVRHEYGHNVQSYIELKMNDKYHQTEDDWRTNFSSFNEYLSAREKYWNEKREFEKELLSLAGKKGSSEYSNTNTMELFAEGFAEYTSGSNTEFGIEFGKFLKRWY